MTLNTLVQLTWMFMALLCLLLVFATVEIYMDSRQDKKKGDSNLSQPCKDCPRRHFLCQSNCVAYTAAQAERENKKKYLQKFKAPFDEKIFRQQIKSAKNNRKPTNKHSGN